MDLLHGINKGLLAVVFLIVVAVAVTSDDLLTQVVLGTVAVGMAVGLVWDLVAGFVGKILRPRG